MFCYCGLQFLDKVVIPPFRNISFTLLAVMAALYCFMMDTSLKKVLDKHVPKLDHSPVGFHKGDDLVLNS